MREWKAGETHGGLLNSQMLRSILDRRSLTSPASLAATLFDYSKRLHRQPQLFDFLSSCRLFILFCFASITDVNVIYSSTIFQCIALQLLPAAALKSALVSCLSLLSLEGRWILPEDYCLVRHALLRPAFLQFISNNDATEEVVSHHSGENHQVTRIGRKKVTCFL